MPRRVGPRQRDGRGAAIDADPDRTGELAQERYEQAARAGAEIEQAGAGRKVRRACQHRFDDRLGLGPRHQRRAVDGELEAPEFANTREVGERLAPGAAADERPEPPDLGVAERPVVAGEKGLGRKPERMLHQQACVAAGCLYAGRTQPGRRSAERRTHGLGPAVHSASARRAARSAVISGSMTSSSASPLSTLSSL